MNQTTNTTAGIDLDKLETLARELRGVRMFSQEHFALMRQVADGACQLIELARRSTSGSTNPMCERKTNDIMQRDGYRKTGYVLMKDDPAARICVSDQGAVSWFTREQWNWLMHNRDHVEFQWPKPIGAKASGSDALEYRTCCDHPDCTTCAGRGGFYRCGASGSDGTAAAGAAGPCVTCNGTGVVDDGEIDRYPNGEPYMCGPVKCVKDCPACTNKDATSRSELADGRALVEYLMLNFSIGEASAQGHAAKRRALAQQAGAPALIQALETGDERESSHWFDISAGEVSTYTEEGHRVRYLYERAAPAPAAQDERDAKDAARYRWLRDVCPEFEAMASPWLYDDLDKAIDAAMSQSKTQEGA